MGEFTGVHRKIKELSDTMSKKIDYVGGDVSYMRGKLDATLPHLARTEEVKDLIADHKVSCKKSIVPRLNGNDSAKKNAAKIAGAITVLASAVYGLIEVIRGLIANFSK